METPTSNDINKKGSLESLSKEELIKKCSHLLQLAQKAKQSKLVLQEENDKLKEELNNTKMNELIEKELIENFTVQKLELVTSNQDLKTQNENILKKFKLLETELKETRDKLTECDNENTSYKRQINRLTEENEQLITDLDYMEKQIQELKKSNVELSSKSEQSKVELQKMLTISLEEVKKLKTENNELKLNGESLNSDNDNKVKELEEISTKQKQKLKFYHSKIVKFACIAKELRTSKNELLNLFKSYIDQVKEWESQLNAGEKKIATYLSKLEQENNDLRITLESKNNTSHLQLENELIESKQRIEQLEIDLINLKQYEAKVVELEQEMNSLKSTSNNIKDELESELKIVKDRYESEKLDWEKELNESKAVIEKLTEENKSLMEDKSLFIDLENTKKLLQESELKIIKIEQCVRERENEIQLLRKENSTTSRIKEDLIEELEKLNFTKKTYEKSLSDFQHQVKSLEELERRSSEEIKNLADENKSLVQQNESLQEKLLHYEYLMQNRCSVMTQTNEAPCNVEEYEELIANLKRENTELLSEMNEMNQAIKERGENISKLEAHCEEVLKKLQIYETQANKNIDNITEKEKIIEELNKEIKELKSRDTTDSNEEYKNEIDALKNEIEVLKDRLNSNDCSYTDDVMSTSTISRTEEINRLKDLEGSWEERYGKLRNLAVKLKGKVRELTQSLTVQQSENEDLQLKLSTNTKSVQILQNQCDKLQDDLDKSKKECVQLQNQLSGAASDISRDKQSIANSEEIITELKIEIENRKKEKEATENWKKQVSAKIQTLRKELEANNVLKKDYEAKIAQLNTNLDAKEQALKTEIESHKQTKNLLEQSNNERKKNSVLSLEMQDYERSAKESTKKIEKQQEEIANLKIQMDNQKTTINVLREQNKLLEDRILEEESNVNNLTTEISTYKKQIINLEEELSTKIDKIHSLTQQLETSRSETEELSRELSKLISEHQKTNSIIKNERDQLSSENMRLQQFLREAQDSYKLKLDEIKVLQDEYDGYKVRAQSVLRQNQTRDVAMEEKLSEEVSSLGAQNTLLTTQIEDFKKHIDVIESTNNKLSTEVAQYKQKIQDLEEDCEGIRSQYADLSIKYEKTVAENAETIRNMKVHADTLSQCYRQQLADQESRHNKEILELQSRLDKAPSPGEPTPVVPTMPRGEGEGSESIGSNNSSIVHPVPLERLLGNDSEQEIDRIKKKLHDNESKVLHLTSLLSDTEQDLVKHVQMNKLLKEEIRRHQRSEEREKHAENLEYLKNIVFKFVTLNSGDERSRLVPVLNTILKLSPDETKLLNSVASGGAGSLKGWSSYLPTWSPK